MFCSKCRIGLWAFSGDAANNKSALPSPEPLIWTDSLEQKLPPCLKLKTIIFHLCKDTEVIKKKLRIYSFHSDLQCHTVYNCHTGSSTSVCMKTNAYQATKNTLLGHKNGICTFLRCGHLIFNHSFLHASMHTYVKCTHSFGRKKMGNFSVIFFVMKTKTNWRCSLNLPAFFKILKEPALLQKPGREAERNRDQMKAYILRKYSLTRVKTND